MALAIALFLLLALCSLSGISSYYDGATVSFFLFVLFSLVFSSFFFSFGFFLGFLDFDLLFGLVGLILALALRGRIGFLLSFFNLFVVGLIY